MLEEGPRKLTVCEGLCTNREDFEQAIGQLFLKGVVKFVGAKTGRKLSRR